MSEPKLGARLRHYVGFHLPVEYREWVETDIASDAWARRGAWIGFVVASIALAIATAITGEPLFSRVIGAAGGFAICYALNVMSIADLNRQRVLPGHRRYWKDH